MITAGFVGYINFNPPTPHGVGPLILQILWDWVKISIHPPRMGWDARFVGCI